MTALDATLAGLGANSYVTVAEADAFATTDLGRNAEAWDKATATEKERALMRATREIDLAVGRVDASYDPLQTLLFPRWNDLVPDTSSPQLPARLGWATYTQAAFLLVNAKALDDASTRRAQGLSNFVNPDGTGGQVADDLRAIHLSPLVEPVIESLSSGSVIATIVVP